MHQYTSADSASVSSDIELDTQGKRLNAAVSSSANLEVKWLGKDMLPRRDMRQPGASDAVLLAGALEHRPSESYFDGSKIPNFVLTTITGYKQLIDLVQVISSTHKIFREAAAAVGAYLNNAKIIRIEKASQSCLRQCQALSRSP